MINDTKKLIHFSAKIQIQKCLKNEFSDNKRSFGSVWALSIIPIFSAKIAGVEILGRSSIGIFN